MKKNTGTTAFVVANAVVLSLITLNCYKPQLTKLGEKYVKVKRKSTKFNTLKELETKRIIKKASKIVGNPENLINESMILNSNGFRSDRLISLDIYSYIVDKFMNYNSFNMVIAKDLASLYPKRLPVLYLSIEDRYQSLFDNIQSGAIALDMNEPMAPTLPFRKIIGMMALIITLNTLGSEALSSKLPYIDFSQETIEETIQDLDTFINDKMDIILTLNNHEEIVNRKVERVLSKNISLEEKLNSIMSLKRLTLDDKINAIWQLPDVDDNVKFEFFINSGYFTYDETLKIIADANIEENTNFDFIMNLSDLSIEEKVNYIVHAKTNNYREVFDYILDNPNINKSIGGEIIAESSVISYDEMFNYFANRNDSIDDKVWNILLIPNQEFTTVFNDLLALDGVKQDEVIKAIMKAELINFDTLFNHIRGIDNISSKDLSNYLVYYNTNFGDSYKSKPLKEMVTYALSIDKFSYNDKINCFWGLLDNLEVPDKQEFILDYYNIDYEEDYIPLLTADYISLTNKQKMIVDLFAKINELKLEYVLSHYGFNNIEEFMAVCAGCAAEGANDYNDIYWVANIIFNRITDPGYSEKGTNPYIQFTSPRQFAVYIKGAYLDYLNPRDELHEEKNTIATQAVLDMFYSGYDGIEHNYIEFRSWSITDFSDNYVVEGGNRYKVTLEDEERLVYEDLNGSDAFLEDNENALTLTIQ